MTDLVRAGTVFPRVHHSRWIVDCPDRDGCGSALQLNRGEREFQCWDCGEQAEVVWPANAVDIETMLLMRPHRKNRNWNPGETLHDLLLENLANGVHPPLDNAIVGAPLLAIEGDRLTVGALTSVRRAALTR